MILENFLTVTCLQAIGIAIGIGILYRKLVPAWRKYRKSVAAMKNIDCDPPHWLFGHMRVIKGDADTFYRYCELLKKFPKCQPVWVGSFFVYLQGYYPDFAKALLNSNTPKDDHLYRFLRPWIGDGLLTSHGAKWKRDRRLLTPAFHFDILKKYLVCMNESTEELLSIWLERTGKQSKFLKVEVFRDVSKMTLDSILRCIISKRTGCQRNENNDYLKAVKFLAETAMKRVFNPLYHSDFIFYLTPRGRASRRAEKAAHDFTSHAIDERQKLIDNSGTDYRPTSELDFLDTLLLAKDDEGKGLSRQEIRDELDTFVFEGHDTVSSGISWALYNLASYPHFQDKCRKEVLKILKDKPDIDWNDLNRFKYLTMFIKESMRLYPPVYAIGRKTENPLCFPRGFGKDQYNCSADLPQGDQNDSSKTFDKDTNIVTAIQYLHCHPMIWQEPFVFDPERFTPENCSKRSPYAYIPFSAGPRNCIGQNFAMNEMKVTLARILVNFQLHLNSEMPQPEREAHIVLRSKTGIHLKLERISN